MRCELMSDEVAQSVAEPSEVKIRPLVNFPLQIDQTLHTNGISL